jgi:hypothetical protein
MAKEKPTGKRPGAKSRGATTVICDSLSQVAAMYGRTSDQVQREWRKDWPADCFTADGRYELVAISRWYRGRFAQSAEAQAMALRKKELEGQKPPAVPQCAMPRDSKGGWGGIRTPGAVARTAVFKTAALDHSATHPVSCAIIAGAAE